MRVDPPPWSPEVIARSGHPHRDEYSSQAGHFLSAQSVDSSEEAVHYSLTCSPFRRCARMTDLHADEIGDLIREASRMVPPDVETYVIGDGASWKQRFDHEFDTARKRSAITELRTRLLQRMDAFQSRAALDEEQRALFAKLTSLVRQSDQALIQTANLIGLTPGTGLFEEIRRAVGRER